MPFLRPQPHRIDARSLATFRILLAAFILHDIYRRLEHGRLSLAWYYSEDQEDRVSYFLPPILHPNDTPHGSPVHKIWFYRGSPQLEIVIFAITIVLAILFGIGHKTQLTSILLWLFVNSIQNRSPHLADGSDLYLRNMLLWCTVCPVGQCWSYDAVERKNKAAAAESNDTLVGMKKKSDDIDDGLLVDRVEIDDDDDTGTKEAASGAGITTRSATVLTRRRPATKKSEEESKLPKESSKPTEAKDTLVAHNDSPYAVVQSIGALGCTLQVIFMYYGAVYRRFSGKMWLWPNLTAVYYVMNNAFATRQWAADMVRANLELSRWMTGGALIAEVLCPVALLLARCDGKSWRHLPAVILVFFHLSLYACMRLFNWQFMSIICCVIFVPTHVWDRLSGASSRDASTSSKMQSRQEVKPAAKGKSSLGAKAKKFFSGFFLFYMIYNFCGERQWIAKHDNGDIGEFLRFNQNWLMYGPDVSTSSMVTLITGKVLSEDSINTTDITQGRHLDILKAIRTRDWGSNSEIDHATYLSMRQETPGDMAASYPSWRWEVALKDWVKDRVKPVSMTPSHRVRRLGRVLCDAANDAREGKHEGINYVELIFWSMETVDFGVATMDHRFERARHDDIHIKVECKY